MSLGKRDISTYISSKTLISSKQSLNILNKLIEIIRTESIKKDVKIKNFGTFYIHYSPKRIGRNPKTRKEYVIPKKSKLSLKASSYVKNYLN